MLKEMSVQTWFNWQEYFKLEPGLININNQLAILLTMLSRKGKFTDFGGVRIIRTYTDEEIEAQMKAMRGYGKKAED